MSMNPTLIVLVLDGVLLIISFIVNKYSPVYFYFSKIYSQPVLELVQFTSQNFLKYFCKLHYCTQQRYASIIAVIHIVAFFKYTEYEANFPALLVCFHFSFTFSHTFHHFCRYFIISWHLDVLQSCYRFY